MILKRTLSENAHELGILRKLILLIELLRLWLVF